MVASPKVKNGWKIYEEATTNTSRPPFRGNLQSEFASEIQPTTDVLMKRFTQRTERVHIGIISVLEKIGKSCGVSCASGGSWDSSLI